MTASIHPYVATAADLLERVDLRYTIRHGRLITGFPGPPEYRVSVRYDDGLLIVTAQSDAPIKEPELSAALAASEAFNRRYYAPQTAIQLGPDGLHPVGTIAIPVAQRDPKGDTETLPWALSSVDTWRTFWTNQHLDVFDLRPVEQWLATGLSRFWAEILTDEGYLPADAQGVDDVESFASELLLERCTENDVTSA